MPPRPAMMTPHASNLGSTKTARAVPISWPDAIQCSLRGTEASERPGAPTGDVGADGGQAYGRSLLGPRSLVLARALFSAVPCLNPVSGNAG